MAGARSGEVGRRILCDTLSGRVARTPVRAARSAVDYSATPFTTRPIASSPVGVVTFA